MNSVEALFGRISLAPGKGVDKASALVQRSQGHEKGQKRVGLNT
jgi:hypothetical protein